jgi:glycerol-3-phosphate acyltransferase PlsX
MRIAVDAMGGDHAPREIVLGAVKAARELPDLTSVILVGDSAAIQCELDAGGGTPDNVVILHAAEVIGMDESPAQAIRRKRDSSISRAMELVKRGEADAMVSAGNTGALVVAATLMLRTLKGVDRPAIAAVMPTRKGPFVLVDAGANPECDASLLRQFAVMGELYARVILGKANPVVGLLGIGVEASKGNEVTREAFGLLKSTRINFKGNVEGHDLFEGDVDVVVCDGFTGNVVLKTSESAARAISHWMRQEFTRTPIRKFGALLLSGARKSMKARMDPEMYGGAPLLGVNGICIKIHGGSSRRAAFHGIRVACASAHEHLNDMIEKGIADSSRAQ